MDVTDALRRIVMRHLVLIAIATLIPVIGFAAYSASKPATYTASAQVEVAYRASTSAQAATATADTPSAFAKTNDAVAAALQTAKVTHNVDDFIASDLTITPVLTAPDIQIEVKYTNQQDAVNIAEALASATVDHFYNQAKSGAQKDFDTFSSQLSDAKKQYTADQLSSSKIAAGLNNPFAAAVNLDIQTITNLQKNVSDAQTKLNEADAEKPSIVDHAKIVPTTTLAQVQPYVLVLVLGLILGVGIAAVLESAAPSVIGAAGLSGLFGAPHLGWAVGRGGKVKGRITDLALAARLHAAARRVGADTVVIAGDVRCDLPDLAGRLDALLGGATNQQIVGNLPGQAMDGPGAPDPKMLNAGEGSKELATRQSSAPALFSERLSFGEDIPSVWVHPRVVPYDEQVLLLLSTAPVSVAVAVVGAPKGKRSNLTPAIELVETSGWEILGTIIADPTLKTGTV
jgi:capsular polysaccharide biosynthesis protein